MKLYWRFKKPDGKWSYRRAQVDHKLGECHLVVALEEEE